MTTTTNYNEKRLKWHKAYETGIERIDFEHKVFLELINSFCYAINNQLAAKDLSRLISEIEKYAEFHFISEENFMRRINYPDYNKHQKDHFELLEYLNLYKHKAEDFGQYARFLHQWFVNHTIHEDIKIKTFIQENNIDVDQYYYNLNISK